MEVKILSKINVCYTEFGGGFDFFKNKLENHLPLQNIPWEDKLASSQVAVHLNFLSYDNEKKTKDNILSINWYKKPYLVLFIIENEAMENYKSLKLKLKEFIAEMKDRNLDFLIISILQANSVMGRMENLILGSTSSVYDKLKSDFSRENRSKLLVQIKRVESVGDDWNELLKRIRELISNSFSKMIKQYNNEIDSVFDRRNYPGWNYCHFFSVKEGLAFTYLQAKKFDQVLQIYEELEQLYDSLNNDQKIEKFLQENMNQIKGAEEDSLGISEWSSYEYKNQIYQNQISEFQFRKYIFSRKFHLLLALTTSSTQTTSSTLTLSSMLLNNNNSSSSSNANLNIISQSQIFSTNNNSLNSHPMNNIILFTTQFIRKIKHEIIKNTQSFPSNIAMKLFMNSFIYSTIQSAISMLFHPKDFSVSFAPVNFFLREVDQNKFPPFEDLLISIPIMSLNDFNNEYFHSLIGELLFMLRHSVEKIRDIVIEWKRNRLLENEAEESAIKFLIEFYNYKSALNIEDFIETYPPFQRRSPQDITERLSYLKQDLENFSNTKKRNMGNFIFQVAPEVLQFITRTLQMAEQKEGDVDRLIETEDQIRSEIQERYGCLAISTPDILFSLLTNNSIDDLYLNITQKITVYYQNHYYSDSRNKLVNTLNYDIAKVNFMKGEYEKAIGLLKSVLIPYIEDKWSSISNYIYLQLAECEKHLSHDANYVSTCLNILKRSNFPSFEYAARNELDRSHQHNLMQFYELLKRFFQFELFHTVVPKLGAEITRNINSSIACSLSIHGADPHVIPGSQRKIFHVGEMIEIDCILESFFIDPIYVNDLSIRVISDELEKLSFDNSSGSSNSNNSHHHISKKDEFYIARGKAIEIKPGRTQLTLSTVAKSKGKFACDKIKLEIGKLTLVVQNNNHNSHYYSSFLSFEIVNSNPSLELESFQPECMLNYQVQSLNFTINTNDDAIEYAIISFDHSPDLQILNLNPGYLLRYPKPPSPIDPPPIIIVNNNDNNNNDDDNNNDDNNNSNNGSNNIIIESGNEEVGGGGKRYALEKFSLMDGKLELPKAGKNEILKFSIPIYNNSHSSSFELTINLSYRKQTDETFDFRIVFDVNFCSPFIVSPSVFPLEGSTSHPDSAISILQVLFQSQGTVPFKIESFHLDLPSSYSLLSNHHNSTLSSSLSSHHSQSRSIISFGDPHHHLLHSTSSPSSSSSIAVNNNDDHHHHHHLITPKFGDDNVIHCDCEHCLCLNQIVYFENTISFSFLLNRLRTSSSSPSFSSSSLSSSQTTISSPLPSPRNDENECCVNFYVHFSIKPTPDSSSENLLSSYPFISDDEYEKLNSFQDKIYQYKCRIPLLTSGGSKHYNQSNFSIETSSISLTSGEKQRSLSLSLSSPTQKLAYQNELLQFEVDYRFPTEWKFGSFLEMQFTITRMDGLEDLESKDKRYSYSIDKFECNHVWIISGKSKATFTFSHSSSLTFQCKLYPISTGWLPVPNVTFHGIDPENIFFVPKSNYINVIPLPTFTTPAVLMNSTE